MKKTFLILMAAGWMTALFPAKTDVFADFAAPFLFHPAISAPGAESHLNIRVPAASLKKDTESVSSEMRGRLNQWNAMRHLMSCA